MEGKVEEAEKRRLAEIEEKLLQRRRAAVPASARRRPLHLSWMTTSTTTGRCSGRSKATTLVTPPPNRRVDLHAIVTSDGADRGDSISLRRVSFFFDSEAHSISRAGRHPKKELRVAPKR